MITRRVADQLPWTDSLIKTASAWGRKSKKLIMKDSVQFLNRKGEKFDWDNDDLDDLEVKKDPSKLIHPDVLAEFPGMELQRDQNTPSRVTVRTEPNPVRKEPDPTKQAAAARVAAGLDAPPEASATTRGVDDAAHAADGTGDADQGVNPESDGPPDMISDDYSDSESDSDSEDENEDEDTIAKEDEDTVADAFDEDSVGDAEILASIQEIPVSSPVQRTSRGRVTRRPSNFVPTMTGKSHGNSRDIGVNSPLLEYY